ncbi:MAG: LD-carboxypeptidase [Desulfurivibrio sp.]|nr:LD-carboxypeptidase [Desulfurivibrio sp.]
MNSTAERRWPPPLAAGDTIGICAPAGPVRDRQAAEAGLRLLRQAGFQLRLQPGLLDRHRGYLAGDDQQRATELHDLWRDPTVKALLALRGGYGCLRLLELLDWELMATYDKLLIGFSDLTVLHAALNRRCRLISLHGPMITTLAGAETATLEHFFATLTGKRALDGSRLRIRRPAELEILRPGRATGPLAGGNLTCLSHLLGTGWEPELDGAILLLEDIGEAAYRLDRALTQLALSGRLAGVAAVILGEFSDCRQVEEIWQRVLELTGDHVPVWANFPAGHGRRNLALPLGATIELDSRRQELRCC